MPTCRREREQCLGQCGGNESHVLQDFITYASKSEVSTRVLGTARMERGRANCTTHDHVFQVPLFDGLGEQFALWASRLRVRGGFNGTLTFSESSFSSPCCSHTVRFSRAAIDPRACKKQPAACAAVHKVLEKDPTLTFVNGRFVPAHELTPPAPPPPPGPPPRYNLFTSPAPSPHPPAPAPPPPWYRSAETCLPVITAAEAENIITADGLERAVCVYVRAVQDERVRADRCFSPISPSPPPPPPTPQSHLAAVAAKALARRVRQGGTNGPYAANDLSSRQEYSAEAAAKQKEQLVFLDDLSDSNPQLKSILSGIQERVGGRRLWQRDQEHRSHDFDDSILHTVAFGGAPVYGVDIAECQALCEAIDNATVGSQCKAIAYARLNSDPRDLTLRQCYLLTGLGGCSAGSFAAAVFYRRDTDGCTAPTERDNPMCVQLASSRTDLRVMSFDDAASVCRNGKGRPRVAFPKTYLEVRDAHSPAHTPTLFCDLRD